MRESEENVSRLDVLVKILSFVQIVEAL